MASLNKWCGIANVGKDPSIATTQSGKDVATFSVACSESWNNRSSGERETKTTWISCVVYNESIVDVVRKYVKKGSKIYIEGSLSVRKYTDKDGIERYVTEVLLQAFNGKLILLDGRDEEKETPKKQPSLLDDDDDMPPL